MSKQPPPATTASAVGPCPTLIQTSRTPRHWKFTQDHRTTRPPLALIVKEAIEVLDPGVVKFAGQFNQQRVDPWYHLWLLAEAVDSDAVDGQVTLLIHFEDLRDGRGGIDPLKVQTIFGGVLLWVMWWRWICQSRSEGPIVDSGHPCFLPLTNAFIDLTAAGSGM